MTRRRTPPRTEATVQSPAPIRQQAAALSIVATADYLKRYCASVFDEHDTTPQQCKVLSILRAAMPEGLPTLEIAKRMMEKTPGITRLLDRMEAKQLVSRERLAHDRRTVLCRLSARGLELLSRIEKPMSVKVKASMGNLSDAEIDQLVGLLKRVRREA